MDEDVAKMLLQGLTTKEFVVFYLVGIAGIIVRFLVNLVNGIKHDPNTENTFKFRYFIKGLARLIISLIVMAVVIARFQEYSPHLVNLSIEFSVPTRLAEGVNVEAIAGITAGLAFGVGLGIDEIVKRLVGETDKRGKKIISRLKNGK